MIPGVSAAGQAIFQAAISENSDMWFRAVKWIFRGKIPWSKRFQPRGLFGEMALIDEKRRSALRLSAKTGLRDRVY